MTRQAAPANLSTDVHVHPSCVRAGVLPYLTANTIYRTVGEKNGWAVGLVHCSACGQTWATTVAVRPVEEQAATPVLEESTPKKARALFDGEPAPRKARTLIAKAQALGLDVRALAGDGWVGVRATRPGTASGWVVLWAGEGDTWKAAGAWRLDGAHRHAVASRDVDADLKALGSAA